MKSLLLAGAFCISAFGYAQHTSHNFNFENHEDGIPTNWNTFGQGDYKTSLDTQIFQEGAASVSIETHGDKSDFNAWGYTIPATFGGKEITLTGYVKTENVSEGYAGLWMRIDPQVGFDNMNNRGVTGTTDWKKYSITLPHNPAEATNIVIGGILVGKGKMWLDNLEVTVDGKPLEDAPEKALLPAQKDTEFDMGSGITINNPSPQELENLIILGKVWGFLKYYHPAIATGDLNWDYELFRNMNEIAFAKAETARDTEILQWINDLGAVPICKKCTPTSNDAAIRPDHEWLKNSGLSEALQEKLQYVYENRSQGKHYYIEGAPNVGNPVFKNEKAYENMPYPDDGFRVLALYRYWNAIQYFFPYKDVTDKDWNTVLAEYLPIVIAAQDELAYEKAMIQVIGEVKDTHANLWGGADKWRASKGEKRAPIRTKFIEDQLTIVDFFNPEMQPELGLKLGDVITHIEGKKVTAIVEEKRPFYPASNTAARMRDIALDVLKGDGNTLQLSLLRDGKRMNTQMPLYANDALDFYTWYPKPKEDKSYKMLPDNIGYVTLANITNEDPTKIKKLFKNTEGIIIDIRNYPSAFMPFALAPYFAGEDAPFVKFTRANYDNPGTFLMGEPLRLNTSTKQMNQYKGKLVVLVNELSQSQAEYTTMSFQAGQNTTVIGSTTAGADGNVSNIPLPGGMRTMISGIGVFYPDGTPTQRIGVKLDEVVTPTIQGIKEGRDELLERAIAIIKQ